MIIGFSGYDGLPVVPGDNPPGLQLVQQAIVPLGNQMKDAGRSYIQATGDGGQSYYLMTADFLDTEQMKRMAMGAALGVLVGLGAGVIASR